MSRGDQAIAARILSSPELADGFGRVIQPIGTGEQRNQFDGAKEFYRVGLCFPTARSFPALTLAVRALRLALQQNGCVGGLHSPPFECLIVLWRLDHAVVTLGACLATESSVEPGRGR